MSVKAKFKVTGVTKRQGWGDNPFVWDIKLNPVVGNTEENKSFYAATPSGEITLGTVNENAANAFEPGKDYYVTFEEAAQ